MHVNERQKISHYRSRSGPLEKNKNKKKKKNKNKNTNKKPKWRFLTSRGAHVNCAIMAMLYTHPIGNQP